MTTMTALSRRPYGNSGVELSIIGFGGILVMNAPQEHADALVVRAVEAGINYFDVAPTYGNAEERLGPALQPFRNECFLACKTTCRDAASARKEMAGSFERLRTDHFDLYQLHGLVDMAKDVDPAFARGGVIELLAEAKKSGLIRHIGFSVHSFEAAMAALDRFPFDSILMPVNFATFQTGQFGPSIVAEARRRNVTILALKALARNAWPEGIAKDHPDRKRHSKCWYQPLTDPEEINLALRFTLSQPVTSAIPPGEEDLFWQAVEVARNFTPLADDELARVRALAASIKPLFPQTR